MGGTRSPVGVEDIHREVDGPRSQATSSPTPPASPVGVQDINSVCSLCMVMGRFPCNCIAASLRLAGKSRTRDHTASTAVLKRRRSADESLPLKKRKVADCHRPTLKRMCSLCKRTGAKDCNCHEASLKQFENIWNSQQA